MLVKEAIGWCYCGESDDGDGNTLFFLECTRVYREVDGGVRVGGNNTSYPAFVQCRWRRFESICVRGRTLVSGRVWACVSVWL